jgi:hypothetical protein
VPVQRSRDSGAGGGGGGGGGGGFAKSELFGTLLRGRVSPRAERDRGPPPRGVLRAERSFLDEERRISRLPALQAKRHRTLQERELCVAVRRENRSRRIDVARRLGHLARSRAGGLRPDAFR